MNDQPNGHVNPRSNGHLPNGKFAPGNRWGTGSPVNRRIAEMRARLLDAVDGDQIERIGKKLAEQAEQGDLDAAKLLLSYVCGRPPQAVEISGPEGSALGPGTSQLVALVMASLADYPDARIALAAGLRKVTDAAGD